MLDVGCGPGVHDVYFSKGLGIHVTGIDIAPSMIEIAKNNAEKNGLADKCTFKVENFDTATITEKYDASFSVGVLEYIEDPTNFIKKMMAHSKYIIFSLPVKWHWLTPQRIVRYKLRNCPLWFYTKNDLRNLMAMSGAEKFQIKQVGRDYLVIIETA